MSDVPVGVLLSGGLDSTDTRRRSSATAAARCRPSRSASRRAGARRARTHARRVAEHFGTEHHEIELSERAALDFLPTLIRHQDEPLGDPVCMPLHFVCGLAREKGVKVVLAGEGADELFWGYPRYSEDDGPLAAIRALLRLARARSRVRLPAAAGLEPQRLPRRDRWRASPPAGCCRCISRSACSRKQRRARARRRRRPRLAPGPRAPAGGAARHARVRHAGVRVRASGCPSCC